MTRPEKQQMCRIGGELLRLATLQRNSAAILTERSTLPMAEELGAALRSWAERLEGFSLELSTSVLKGPA